jgi:ankyrin repeat protein
MDPLIYAIEQRNVDEARRLIPTSDLTVVEEYGTALHYAIKNKLVKIVEPLLSQGANPSLQDAFGKTALHRAVAYLDTTMVKLLLDFGVDQSIQDRYGDTALHMATRRSSNEIFALLLRDDIIAITNNNGDTIVDIILCYGWATNMKLLLPFIGPYPNILHRIISKKFSDMLEIVLPTLSHYIDAPNENGTTPYTLAVKLQDQSMIDLLDLYRIDIKEPEC